MSMKMTSDAFSAYGTIPVRYTEDGANVSPPLKWTGVPDGAEELALICDDPDAPTPQPWVHWVIYKIAPEVHTLPEKVPTDLTLTSPITACQGRNSWSAGKTTGYRGPAPPPGHGIHHYHFRLYALDTKLDVQPGLNKSGLEKAMDGHILEVADLVGLYGRRG